LGAKLDIDITSFSHGQITSKIWLCDHIETYLTPNTKVLILGAWYNVLGFMLLTRYKEITKLTGIDINPEVKPIADKICDAWPSIVNNITIDSDKVDMEDYDIIINCSPEHMITNDWFNNIPNNKLVIIQSSDMTIQEEPWLVCNQNTSLVELNNKYKCQTVLFSDTIKLPYSTSFYQRFMIIGKK